MKQLLIAAAATIFAAGVSAHDVYGDLGRGNTELFDKHAPADGAMGVQPGVGSSFDPYSGLAEGNRDLFQQRQSEGGSGDIPNVYGPLGGSPDISW